MDFLRDREPRRIMIQAMGHALLTKASGKGKTAKAKAGGFQKKAAKKYVRQTVKQVAVVAHDKMPRPPVLKKLTRAEKQALADHAVEARVAEVVAQVLQRKPAVNEDLVAMLLGKPDDVLPL